MKQHVSHPSGLYVSIGKSVMDGYTRVYFGFAGGQIDSVSTQGARHLAKFLREAADIVDAAPAKYRRSRLSR